MMCLKYLVRKCLYSVFLFLTSYNLTTCILHQRCAESMRAINVGIVNSAILPINLSLYQSYGTFNIPTYPS